MSRLRDELYEHAAVIQQERIEIARLKGRIKGWVEDLASAKDGPEAAVRDSLCDLLTDTE